MVIEDNNSNLARFLGLSKSAVEPKYSLTYMLFELLILCVDPTVIFQVSNLPAASA